MASLNPNLREFWTTKARNRVLYGGRASSKTYDAAGFAIFLARTYKLKFLCTRQFQNRIAESVYSVLKIQVEAFGLESEFRILESSIIHKVTGSEFIFYGIARNIREIKSTVGVDVLWLEEAEGLTAEQWRVLEPTIRDAGSQVWVVFNPRFVSDFVWQRFVVNPPPNTIVRHINYDENPFLSDDMREIIFSAKDEDYEEYEHVYLGAPRTDEDSVIIKSSWIEAAIDAHIKLGFEPKGKKRIGFDVADSGADKCANVFVHGSVVLWADEWGAGEDELLISCSRTFSAAREREASITYDSIGVGAHAGAKFDELNSASGSGKVRYSRFNAGGAVFDPEGFYSRSRIERIKNKDQFSNLKAQTWWMVADRFRNTFDAVRNGTVYKDDELISISSGLPMLVKLKTELATPKRDFDQNGRVKVESKKDLSKRDIASPNIADAFIMCFAPEIARMKISNRILEMA